MGTSARNPSAATAVIGVVLAAIFSVLAALLPGFMLYIAVFMAEPAAAMAAVMIALVVAALLLLSIVQMALGRGGARWLFCSLAAAAIVVTFSGVSSAVGSDLQLPFAVGISGLLAIIMLWLPSSSAWFRFRRAQRDAKRGTALGG